MLYHAVNGSFIKQIGVVLKDNRKRPAYFHYVKSQIELPFLLRQLQRLEQKLSEFYSLSRFTQQKKRELVIIERKHLQGKGDIKERRTARIPIGLQSLNHKREWIILMIEGIDDSGSHATD